MAGSVAKSLALMHLNTDEVASGQARMAKAGLEPQAAYSEDQHAALQAVVLALRQSGMSHKAAALTAETKESEFSNALHGKGRLDWRWLWAQDATFWAWFWPLVATAKGVSVPSRKHVALQNVLQAISELVLCLEEQGE